MKLATELLSQKLCTSTIYEFFHEERTDITNTLPDDEELNTIEKYVSHLYEFFGDDLLELLPNRFKQEEAQGDEGFYKALVDYLTEARVHLRNITELEARHDGNGKLFEELEYLSNNFNGVAKCLDSWRRDRNLFPHSFTEPTVDIHRLNVQQENAYYMAVVINLKTECEKIYDKIPMS